METATQFKKMIGVKNLLAPKCPFKCGDTFYMPNRNNELEECEYIGVGTKWNESSLNFYPTLVYRDCNGIYREIFTNFYDNITKMYASIENYINNKFIAIHRLTDFKNIKDMAITSGWSVDTQNPHHVMSYYLWNGQVFRNSIKPMSNFRVKVELDGSATLIPQDKVIYSGLNKIANVKIYPTTEMCLKDNSINITIKRRTY